MCKINGKKLEEARLNAGMTQRELAKKSGVSQFTISAYENGKSNPSDENVERICMILKVSKGDIKIQDIGYDFKNGISKVVDHERRRLGIHRLKRPTETEKFITDERTEKESEDIELSNVGSALRQPMSVGSKKYILINPKFIHIPTWQRDTDFAKAKEIEVNFDESKFDPVKVYRKNGKLYVADGAHRLIAVILINRKLPDNEQMMILVEVLDCDEAEARRTFLGQQAGRKNMTINDMYRAAIENGEPDYIALKRICECNNIQITAEEKAIDNPVGKLTASRAVLRMAVNDNEMMQKTIDTMNDLNWTGSEKNVFTIRNFTVIKRLFAKYGEEVKYKLIDNCKGAAFYEAKVLPVKSDAELFDVLVEAMNI